MKRREFLKLSATIAGASMTMVLPVGWSPAKAAAKWKVGFSQCTTLEPWRVQFNKDIEAEAKKHPDVDLVITELGVFTIDKHGAAGMALIELADGVTLDEVKSKTEADFRVALKNA